MSRLLHPEECWKVSDSLWHHFVQTAKQNFPHFPTETLILFTFSRKCKTLFTLSHSIWTRVSSSLVPKLRIPRPTLTCFQLWHDAKMYNCVPAARVAKLFLWKNNVFPFKKDEGKCPFGAHCLRLRQLVFATILSSHPKDRRLLSMTAAPNINSAYLLLLTHVKSFYKNANGISLNSIDLYQPKERKNRPAVHISSPSYKF